MTFATEARTVPAGTTHAAASLPFSGARLVKFLALERDYLNKQDKLALCARIKDARVKAGLTEQEIADLLDPPVTDRTIRNYESERPPFKYLRQWAELTSVDYYWLLRGDEAPPVSDEPGLDLPRLAARLEDIAQMTEQGFAALERAIDRLDARLAKLEG